VACIRKHNKKGTDMKVCDFCKGEKNKYNSFDYQIKTIKIPTWGAMTVTWHELDLCFSCLKECFNLGYICQQPIIKDKGGEG